MGIFGSALLRKPMFGGVEPLPGYMGGSGFGDGSIETRMGMNDAPMGGYDRNAAMKGQSGFSPMNQNAPQKKPGFFSKGGGWIDALGAFGDAFSENGPVYAQQKAQRNRLMQEQQMAEQRRQAERENFLFEESYKRANPMPKDDKLAIYMRNAGIDPSSEQGKAMYNAALTNEIYPEKMIPFVDAQGNEGLMRTRSGMPPQQSGGVQEGATATNPRTNEKIIFRNGKWEPVGGGVGKRHQRVLMGSSALLSAKRAADATA